MTQPNFVLIRPSLIRPTEAVLPERVDEVVAMILECGAWTHPICIEGTMYALLDGHHRLAAAQRLELARVPVRVFDYAEVEVVSRRPDYEPTRADVLARAASGELYPYKTTRHHFPDLAIAPVPLARLCDEQASRPRLVAGRTAGPDGVDTPCYGIAVPG